MGIIESTAKIVFPGGLHTEDESFLIGDFCLITVPSLSIGSHSQINAGSKVLGREPVTIGRHTVISYDCLLLTSSDIPDPHNRLHDDFSPEENRQIRSAPITIGDHCYLGAKCVVMPGTRLFDYTVIPAGSYVSGTNWSSNAPRYRPLGHRGMHP